MTGPVGNQPGDPLRGQPESYLAQVAEQAAAEAQTLDLD